MDKSFLTDARHYPIKPAHEKNRDERLLEQLRNPQVANFVEACAKTLNDTFNNQAKTLVDIRPGARFKNVETQQVYIYEAAITPFKHSDIARLVLQEAKRPVEELLDQAYFVFRTVVPGRKTDIVLTEDAGERFTMPGREFVAYFAIKIFELIDMNNNEKDLIEKAWRPRT